MALPVTGQTLASPEHSPWPVQVAADLSVQPVAQSAQSFSVQDESLMFAPEARQATPKVARHRPSSSFFMDSISVSIGAAAWRPGVYGFARRVPSPRPARGSRASRLGSARLRGDSAPATTETGETPLDREDPSLEDSDESEAVDLHGLSVEKALRRVAQSLHAARVRGRTRLLVVTGAGWCNADQKPVLRPAVEAWLRGPEGRALGVKDVQRVHRDGALDVRLG